MFIELNAVDINTGKIVHSFDDKENLGTLAFDPKVRAMCLLYVCFIAVRGCREDCPQTIKRDKERRVCVFKCLVRLLQLMGYLLALRMIVHKANARQWTSKLRNAMPSAHAHAHTHTRSLPPATAHTDQHDALHRPQDAAPAAHTEPSQQQDRCCDFHW